MADSSQAPTWPSRRRRRVYCQTQRPNRVLLKPTSKRWQQPEGLAPEEIGAIIDAAATERDRLLLTTLWATAARISEVLTLRPKDIRRQGLVLPNLKNPSLLVKTAHLSVAHAGLPGDLLVWARENGLADDEPLFSRGNVLRTVGAKPLIVCGRGRS
jgi:integrase